MKLPRAWLGAYVLALVSSHVYQAAQPRPAPSPAGRGRIALEVPAMDDDGPVHGAGSPGGSVLSLLAWPAAGAAGAEPADPLRLPVLLLHGSPGSARNFEALGARLAADGRAVYALDLPGFGRSAREAPSYSLRAHAHAALAALDGLSIERTHVATWSMGGGVGLQLVELAPERVASLTQIAAIGVQEAEGSGSYHVEHLKYALLYAGLELLPELVPHFGLLGRPGRARAFVRNFWDSDQRPLRAIMADSRTPTLILHGRDDFLVPAWAAEVSHELVAPSRLVVLPASHFLLFPEPHGELGAVLEELVPFLARHDVPGREVERAYLDLTPPPRGLERWTLAPFALVRWVPWWACAVALALLSGLAPRAGPFAAGLGVAGLELDFGLALLACAGGAAGRRRSRRGRKGIRQALLGCALAAACLVGGVVAGGAAAVRCGHPAPQVLALAVLAAWALRVRGSRRWDARAAEPAGP